MKRTLTLLSFLALVAVGCDSGDSETDGITVTGTIDNVTDLGVDDATVTFSEGAARGATVADFTAATDTDGAFSIDIPEGTYQVTVSAPGYDDRTFTYTTGGGAITQELLGPSNVFGTAVGSLTGDDLAGARVSFTRGEGEDVSQDEEAIDLEVIADEDGEFVINGAPTGTYLCVIRADGFLPTVVPNVNFNEGDTNLGGSIPVVEEVVEGQVRIVLSWGADPEDLDTHFTGPNGQGGRFHVYFSDETFSDVAELDLDDTDGNGPETTTVNPRFDGTYRYSVFNYENNTPTGSAGIAGEIENSVPARVQVYNAQGLVRTYTAPASSPGNTWRVFEMNVSGDNVTINDVNEWVTAGGSSDIGRFRAPNTLKAAMSAAGL